MRSAERIKEGGRMKKKTWDLYAPIYTLASGGPYCDCGYKKLRR